MEEQSNDIKIKSKRKRPLFLSILCIVSFIGIAYVIATILYDFFSPSSSQNLIEKLSPFLGSMFDTMDTERFISFMKINKIIGLVAAFICLAGVVLMWKLKKIGYLFYAIGELAPAVAFFILFWNFFHNPLMSFAFLIASILKIVGAIAFLIMYAVNLKRMT